MALGGCAASNDESAGTGTTAEDATGPDHSALHTASPAASEGPFLLRINGEIAHFDVEESDVVEPVTLHAGTPVPVEVTVPGGDAIVTVNGAPLEAEGETFTGEFTLERLDAEVTVPLTVEQASGTTTLHIRTAPDDLPPVVFEGDTYFDTGTFYYANLFPTEATRDYIVKYDNFGQPVFYRNHDTMVFNNFGPWEGDGARGSYYFAESPADDSGFGIRRGRYVVLDEHYRVIDDDARPRTTATYNPKEGPFAEMHEFQVLGPGHYIFLDYYVAEVDRDGVRHYVPYIQELKDGEVVWEWDSWDHELFEDASRAGYVRVPNEESMAEAEVEGREAAIAAGAFTDAIHTNSVSVCPNDGNIIISNRNQSAVMEIERDTGDIAWVLGGKHNTWDIGALSEIGQQHDARMLIDASGIHLLTLYDNRTEVAETSRGLVLQVDEDNQRVLGAEEYTAHGQKGDFTGSTRLFGDAQQYVMVGWGLVRPQPTLATIFDRYGNVLKDITTSGVQMDTYRFVPAEF